MNTKIDISKFFFSSKPVMDSLTKNDLLLLRGHLNLKKVRKGRELFQEGSYPKGVYILKRGKVKIFQRSQNGGEQIIYIYTPGEMFGFRPLLCDGQHPTSAMTLEECGIYFLSVKDFFLILKRSAEFSNILLQNLSHEFTVLVNRIAAFAQKSVKERVALSLLILQEKYRKQDLRYAEITLSRADLASFVGTTNETLARIISKFKREKVIHIHGRKIIVVQPEVLYQLMD